LLYEIRILVISFLALALVFSLDDIVFDIYFYARLKTRSRNRLKIKDLDNVAPQLIAIFVPAWKEEKVIGDMLQNTLTTINYPKSFFHLFIGVYPNDIATQEAIRPLLACYKNLHMVINEINGPTTKANNINYIYHHGLKEYEENNGLSFSIIAIHDSEDIIHPTSLKLINYLIPSYSAIQLPVFPLQPFPTMRNFIKFLTSGTYADEFAENHFRTMVAREIGRFIVPSAGTGFFISRSAVDKIESCRGYLLDEKSLTEDYELSVYMHKIGIKVHYFLEGVARVLQNGRIVNEFIATREFFPNTLREAVKQKARWIYGISFQSAKTIKFNDYNRYQQYSLIRDWKAKYANAITVPCYLLFIYTLNSYLMSLPALITYRSLAWYLSLTLTALALERQIMRAVALKNVYGWRTAILSNFLPPILPIRFTWGNIINFIATLRAWRIHLFGSPKSKSKWDKTEHSYLSKNILETYRRKLGDLLLEKEIVEPQKLKLILKGMKQGSARLGEVLMENGAISEIQLLSVLGELWGTGYLEDIENLVNPALAEIFPRGLAFKFQVVPLLLWGHKVLLASSQALAEAVKQEITDKLSLEPLIILVPSYEIQKALNTMYNTGFELKDSKPKRIGEVLIEEGLIEIDQLFQAFKTQKVTGRRLGEVLLNLNLISKDKLDVVLANHKVAVARLNSDGYPFVTHSELQTSNLGLRCLPSLCLFSLLHAPVRNLEPFFH